MSHTKDETATVPLETNVGSRSTQATFLQGPGIAQLSSPMLVVGAATRLPDEILDRIIWEVCELRHQRQSPLPEPPRGSCYRCSLVCRRWRRISLPYLFRHIRIPSLRRLRKPQSYVQFFSNNPVLGGLVRTADISRCDIAGSDIVQLDTLLAHFPRIQDLDLTVDLPFNPNGSIELDRIGRRIYRNYSVKKLTLWIQASEVKISVPWYHYVLDILSLFSKIHTLYIVLDEEDVKFSQQDSQILNSIAESSAAVAPPGKPSISELEFTDCPPAVVSFLRHFLCNVGTLRDLHSLGLDFMDPEQMLSELETLIAYTGPRLSKLRFAMPHLDGDYWIEHTHDPYHVVHTRFNRLRDMLSKCTSLEKVTLDTVVDREPSSALWKSWLMTVKFVQLIPADLLQELSIGVGLEPYEDTKTHTNVAHSISWQGMRDACRRFTHLRSLELWFHVEGMVRGLDACVDYEMRDFKSILRLNQKDLCETAWRPCDNAECKKYFVTSCDQQHATEA